MTRQIRRVAAVMLVLFGALFLNLNVLQVLRADELANHPANQRLILQEYAIERGPIVVADQEIVRSVETEGDLKYLRVYSGTNDNPAVYSHLTGFYSVVLQRSGLEAALNDQLSSTPTEVLAQNLAELVGSADETGNTVRLTIEPGVQNEAARAMGDRTGAVVALDPRTGAVLASYSNPAYDPSLLTSHDRAEILRHWEQLNADPGRPLLDRVTRATYPPGSTFKLLVTAAALQRGITPGTAFPDLATYDVPQTDADISNFSRGQPCAGGGTITLADALRVSCNTVFARLGVELGADAIIDTAEAFGFNRDVPYDLPTVESDIPKELDVPATAQSAIGQRDVRATPLQMALVAAAIVNDGVLMRPYVVGEVLDPTGRRVRGPESGPWRNGLGSGEAVPPQVAATLAELMVSVVDSGTGGRAQIPGVRVGGKTGTAQMPGQTSTVWFVGFAGDRVAVAVVLPDAGEDATGGRDAAPIAHAVMEAALGRR